MYTYVFFHCNFTYPSSPFFHVAPQDHRRNSLHAEGPGAAPRTAESGPLPNARGGDHGEEEVGGGDEGEAATASLVKRPRGNFNLTHYSIDLLNVRAKMPLPTGMNTE